MSRPQLVVYDVSDDRARRALARRLERVGATPTEESSWVVPPGVPGRRGLLSLFARDLRSGDRLFVYEPCASCERRARWLPGGPSPYRPETDLVVLDGEASCRPV